MSSKCFLFVVVVSLLLLPFAASFFPSNLSLSLSAVCDLSLKYDSNESKCNKLSCFISQIFFCFHIKKKCVEENKPGHIKTADKKLDKSAFCAIKKEKDYLKLTVFGSGQKPGQVKWRTFLLSAIVKFRHKWAKKSAR